MICLDATFTLTPQSPVYNVSPNYASLYCHGADFLPWPPVDFSSLYGSNRFFFEINWAGDPNLNYALFANRKKTRFLVAYISLVGYAAANKQLALIFGFDVQATYPQYPGRVLVYNDSGMLKDQELAYGDNQFLLEIESLDLPFVLYFIHAGGSWFFRGLSGYVV